MATFPSALQAKFARIWDMRDCTTPDGAQITGTQWLDQIAGVPATGPIARPASAAFGGKRGARIQDLSKRMNFAQVDNVARVVVVIRDDGANGDGTGGNTNGGRNLFGLSNGYNADEASYPNGRHWVGNKPQMMGRKNGFAASLCTFSRDTRLSIYSYPLPGGPVSIDGVGGQFENEANPPTNATVCFVGLLTASATLTDADEAQIAATLQPLFNTPTKHKPLVICRRDSRTIGQQLSGNDAQFLGNGWPAQLSGIPDFEGFDFACLAVSGYKPDDNLTGPFSIANCEAVFLPLENPRPVVIFVNWGITNAIVNTTSTGAGEYAKEGQIAAQQRAAMPMGRAKLLLLCTEIDRGADTIVGTATYQQFTQERLAYNALVKANAGGLADAVIDLAAEPRLMDVNNTTYFGDKLHQTVAGYGVVAQVVGSVIQSVAVATITVSPPSVQLSFDQETQQFAAVAKNAAGIAIVPQPTFAWNVAPATIGANGLLTIPDGYAVTASAQGATGTATATLPVPADVPYIKVLVQGPFTLSPDELNQSTGAVDVYVGTNGILRFHLTDGNGNPVAVGGGTLTAQTVDYTALGSPIVSAGQPVATINAEEGYVEYQLTDDDTSVARRLRLTIKHQAGSVSQVSGSTILRVLDR